MKALEENYYGSESRNTTGSGRGSGLSNNSSSSSSIQMQLEGTEVMESTFVTDEEMHTIEELKLEISGAVAISVFLFFSFLLKVCFVSYFYGALH